MIFKGFQFCFIFTLKLLLNNPAELNCYHCKKNLLKSIYMALHCVTKSKSVANLQFALMYY